MDSGSDQAREMEVSVEDVMWRWSGVEGGLVLSVRVTRGDQGESPSALVAQHRKVRRCPGGRERVCDFEVESGWGRMNSWTGVNVGVEDEEGEDEEEEEGGREPSSTWMV